MDQVKPDMRTFKVRDLPSIWGMELKQDWLVDGMFPTCSVSMLSGESGSGKSTVALALAVAVASGEPFLGHKTKKTPVLIVDRENNLSIYSERLKRFDIQENPDLLFWGHFSPLEPAPPNAKPILEFAEQEKPLIIFDSFVAFHTGSEQDADQTREYTDYYRKLAGLGATIVIIHHTGKGDNTKEYRGSSDIKASLDVGMVLTAKKPMLKLLKLHTFKCREGIPEDLMITLEGNKLVPLSTEYVEPEDADWKLVAAVIQANPNCNQSTIIRLLPDMPTMRVRKILMAGELKGTFKVSKGLKNASFYSLGEVKNAQ